MRSALVVVTVLLLASSVCAADWPDVQAAGCGPGSDHERVGGLGFTVLLHPPRLWKIPVIHCSGQYWGKGADFVLGTRLPIDLGTISCEEPFATREYERDWSHAGYQLSPSLKMLVTRMSPALVCECAAPRLSLFGGGKTTPIFYATAKGVFSCDQPVDKALSGAGTPWMLLWFGKGAGMRSTRHPWPMWEGGGGGGGETMSSAVDCPVLVVFERQPASMSVHDGATFTAAERDQVGKIALLPLFGDVYPLASDTEGWGKERKLPADIATDCAWWAERLAEVPMSACERYAYDEAADTVTISTAISYATVRAGGIRLAPLPPMLTLAREQGFPLDLSGEPVRSQVVTAAGPYAAIMGTDRYECRVAGLGKYVKEIAVCGRAGNEPEALRTLLREQIAMIVAAGHLAPWIPACNTGRGASNPVTLGETLEFAAPGRTLAVLGEALPLLDGDQQEEVRAYLKRERREYPPEYVAVMPLNVGARRERSRLDTGARGDPIYDDLDANLRYRDLYMARHLVPIESLYDLSVYARSIEAMMPAQVRRALRRVLPPYWLRQDWATLGSFQCTTSFWGQVEGQGGEMDANLEFTGLIGALRLARQAEDYETLPRLWGQLARVAIRRYAMGRYAAFLYGDRVMLLPTDPTLTRESWGAFCGFDEGPSGERQRLLDEFGRPDWQVQHLLTAFAGCQHRYRWTEPAHDVRAVMRMNEYGVAFNESPIFYQGGIPARYAGIQAPELCRFLADHEPSQARASADSVAENAPDWYLMRSTARLGGETNFHHPLLAYDQFLLRALVLHEPPDKLARWLDVPWLERGDLYYIHKLVETIAAYRGVTWAERPATVVLEPSCADQVPEVWPRPALGNENLPVAIPPAPAAFAIDGELAKWGGIGAIPAPFAKKDAGSLKLAFGADGLFGCVRVPDADITVNAGQPWAADCLELWIESDCARASDMHGHASQLVLAPNPTAGDGKAITVKAQGGIDAATVVTWWRKTIDGYALEFLIPAKQLGLPQMLAGTKLGFNYAVDVKGQAIEQFYSDKNVAQGYRTPVTWGVIELGR